MKYLESGPRDRIFLLIIFLAPICLVLLFIVLGIYVKISVNYARHHIPLMIEAEPSVSKAEIIFDDGVGGAEFYIKILFKDGGRLEVNGVNEWGKGKITIEQVGGYRILIRSKDGGAIWSERAMKFWSAITGLQLESVMDLVRNYQSIYNCVESSPNSSDYRSVNFQEKSSEDKEKEIDEANETMVKIHPSASRATVDGEEYFLLKWEREPVVSTNNNVAKYFCAFQTARW